MSYYLGMFLDRLYDGFKQKTPVLWFILVTTFFGACFRGSEILRSPAGQAREPFPRLRSVAWS